MKVVVVVLLSTLIVGCVADATKPALPRSFHATFLVHSELSPDPMQFKQTYSVDLRKVVMETSIKGQLISASIISDTEQVINMPPQPCFIVPTPNPTFFDTFNWHTKLDGATYGGEETYNNVLCDKWNVDAESAFLFDKQGNMVAILAPKTDVQVVSFESIPLTAEAFAIPASWNCQKPSLKGILEGLAKKLVSPVA
eukprot:GILJ01000858.1.p1 GENE.GILJ01000858.1~~GILJ01000858.1.p1  ORF type:complete len:197 (+),score=34.83 GILJ01000858.1:36-626(+)